MTILYNSHSFDLIVIFFGSCILNAAAISKLRLTFLTYHYGNAIFARSFNKGKKYKFGKILLPREISLCNCRPFFQLLYEISPLFLYQRRCNTSYEVWKWIPSMLPVVQCDCEPQWQKPTKSLIRKWWAEKYFLNIWKHLDPIQWNLRLQELYFYASYLQ